MGSQMKSNIIISGLPRSGSTLLGNLIGSGNKVEYFFEPPLISPLLSLIDELSSDSFKMIYDYYIKNELILSSIAGRRLNFNTNDDSHIYRYKTKDEINVRLNKSWRASELNQLLDQYSIAFKTPGISNNLLKLQSYYPNWKMVIIFRKYEDILKSIIVKGWFDDTNPNIITTYKLFGESRVPNSIPNLWEIRWKNLSVEERAMIYINEQFSSLRTIDNYIRVDYEKLVNDPNTHLNILFNELGVSQTNKTEDLIASIYQKPDNNLNLSLPKGIDFEIKEEAKSHKDYFNI